MWFIANLCKIGKDLFILGCPSWICLFRGSGLRFFGRLGLYRVKAGVVMYKSGKSGLNLGLKIVLDFSYVKLYGIRLNMYLY